MLLKLQKIELPVQKLVQGGAYQQVAQKLLIIQGIALDGEFKGLVA